MSTINIRESLRQLDDDSFCKYDLLTMYDSCPLLDEDKQEIAKLLYDKEDPEVIYQKLCTYFCDDDVSSVDEINDIPISSNFETIVTECLSKLKETYDDAKYNDVANQIEVLSKGNVYTTGLSPVDYDFADIEVFVDGNYDEPMSFDSIEDAVGYIINTVYSKISTIPVTEDDDDVMIYTVYDIVEDDDRLTAKCMNESTNDFQDIKLGKINSQKVNELLNNMLNNPNYKITNEVKKKIYDKSAPWGLAVQMTSAVDVDGTNGLLSTGDFGGEASFGESIETNFEKDDRVTDGSREGTVLDSDSQKVLVEWDYSETDDIEWVDKSDLSFVECLKESEIPMDTVMKDIQSYLNYHLGSNEDYIKVTNVTNVDKNTVAAEYEVHLSIPTGNDEYERGTEYRSLPFRYKDGKWQPVVTESKYDVKTKTNARKLVDKAKADGKKLSMKDAEEIVDQSFNDRVDTIDGLYKSLDFDESNEDDFEPQLPTFDELRKQYKNYTTFKDKEKNSGLIRDLCDQLENKKVSYDIYNHKKDSGMTIFYDDCNLVESLSPYKKEEFKKQLQDELYDKFIDLARTPEWGFENLAEIGDYLMPAIQVNDYEGEYDNDIEVVFTAEVSYHEMEDVCNTLDKVVKKYDKNAYFEPVQPGIAVAYLKLKDSIHESKGPKADKLRELIDEGVVSKDLIVDEFINYLSEDDIADFLNEYDLVNKLSEDLKNDISGGYDEAAEHLMDIIYNEISAEVIDYYIDNSGSSFIITYNNNLDNIRNEAINLSDILTKNGYKVRDWATNGDNVVILRFAKPISLNEGIEDNDELISAEQEFDSAATSINSNKLPAVYSMVRFNPGDVVVDFGGGKFDNAVNYLKDQDVTLLVYDPYNRSAEHNKEVLKVLREHGGADAAVNSNVLNVIKEPEARNAVLQNIKKITKKGAPIYITVYEGSGKGNEGPTKSGYQLNRKTADYIDEIGRVFSNVKRKGKLITAINESFRFSGLRQANIDAIEYFIEFEDLYPFPKGKFLAHDWEELRDGIEMGMDDDLEIAEGIMEYLQKEIDFNNKHKEIYEDDPQAELTLEIYNKVKREYEKEISKYESISSEAVNEAVNGPKIKITGGTCDTKWIYDTMTTPISMYFVINNIPCEFKFSPNHGQYVVNGVDCDHVKFEGDSYYKDLTHSGGTARSYALNIPGNVLKSQPKQNQKDYRFTGQYYSTVPAIKYCKESLKELLTEHPDYFHDDILDKLGLAQSLEEANYSEAYDIEDDQFNESNTFSNRQIDLYYKDHPERIDGVEYVYSYKGYPIIIKDNGWYGYLKGKYSISRNTPEEVEQFIDKEELKESSNPKIVEASYGGAFDIEDDQYFTKEEIVEVAEKVCEHLDETYPDKFDVSDVYMETPTIIHVEVISKEGNWASANAKIDMRKIKKPSDIMKYDVVIGDLVYILRQKLEDLYEDEYMRESFTNDKLSRELQTYLQRLFEDYVEVESVKYFESPFGEESYTAEINVSELVDNYIDKRFTPLTYKLKEDGYLYVNKYSDIIVDVNGYESGVTLDCYSDVPYDVDMEQLDKEADIIGDKIIDVIQSHEEDIYNILRQELEELYVDEEDM